MPAANFGYVSKNVNNRSKKTFKDEVMEKAHSQSILVCVTDAMWQPIVVFLLVLFDTNVTHKPVRQTCTKKTSRTRTNANVIESARRHEKTPVIIPCSRGCSSTVS